MKSDNESFEEQKKPPYYALQFLQLICLNHLYEEIEGDLIQKFERDLKNARENRTEGKISTQNLLRKSDALRIGMSRKGFKISKCGSPEIIQSAFAVKANSKIMLSSGSEEASIFFCW